MKSSWCVPSCDTIEEEKELSNISIADKFIFVAILWGEFYSGGLKEKFWDKEYFFSLWESLKNFRILILRYFYHTRVKHPSTFMQWIIHCSLFYFFLPFFLSHFGVWCNNFVWVYGEEKWWDERYHHHCCFFYTHLFHLLEHIRLVNDEKSFLYHSLHPHYPIKSSLLFLHDTYFKMLFRCFFELSREWKFRWWFLGIFKC